MVKLALLAPVIFALGGAGTVAVDGATPVSLGKKLGTAYPVKCAAPIKFTASGPASLVVDVRGQADAIGKPLELDFTRNDKAVSKNALTLTKSKNAGKGYAGVGQVVLAVPAGVQQYALSCDSASEIGLSLRLSKKAVKANAAVAEVPVEAKKSAPPSKVADGAKNGDDATADDAKAGDAGAPTASGPSTGAYVGLFTPMSF
jgi:hypothetical protein